MKRGNDRGIDRGINRPSFAAAVVGSLVESWAEVRMHRTRVIMSLVGVSIAVASLTSVIGLGHALEARMQQSGERLDGRPATLQIYVNSGESSGAKTTKDEGVLLRESISRTMARNKIEFHTESTQIESTVQFSSGVQNVELRIVDPGFGAIHRLTTLQGAWLRAEDAERLAPAIVVNEAFWKLMGSPALASHPTISLFKDQPTTAVVVGIAPDDGSSARPQLFMLSQSHLQYGDASDGGSPSFEAWVPGRTATELEKSLEIEINLALGKPDAVFVSRQDDPVRAAASLEPLKMGVVAVALLVLFLGALGLINIALVTVRQRIREIGIRRSFGATAGRVFVAVMMESVVASLVAGVIGVIAAIFVVQNPIVQGFIGGGVTDMPGFPISAALVGLAAATAVGAIAGVLPAIVAVRIKVIDAIRY